MFYKTSLIILCFANLFCVAAFSAVIEGTEIELLHTTDVSELHDGCSSDSYKIVISQTAYENILFANSSECPSGTTKFYINGISTGVGPQLVNTTDVSELHDGCSSDSYKIVISQTAYENILFPNSTQCPSGFTRVPFNGISAGSEQTLCDNGYLKNGSCVSYVSFGYQPGFYNLDLDTNTYTDPTNNTCASGYYETSTLHPYFEKCMAAGTEIQLTWEGVDVTGTDAASCYYLGDLYAPTTAPTNVPQGYKFLGWRPRPQ